MRDVSRGATSALVPPSRPWQRTLAATCVMALAVGAAIALAELEDTTSYSVIVAGVALATWYAGVRFGLGATAVAALLAAAFIAEPRGRFALDSASVAPFVLGIATAAGTVCLIEALRRGRRRAEALAQQRAALVQEVAGREQRLVTLADALPVLISYIDADRRYTFNNREYEAWFGHDRAAISGQRMSDVVGKDAYEAVRPYLDSALAGKAASFESLVQYRDAGTRWIQADYVPDVAPDGTVRGVFALVRDTTEQRRAARALTDSEARARGILEAARDGIITIDDEGRIQSFNPAAERLFGYCAHDVVGKAVGLILPEIETVVSRDAVATPVRNGGARFDGPIRDITDARRGDGTTFPASVAVGDVQLQDRHLVTAIVHDLTLRVRAEEGLRTSEHRYRSLVEATTSVVWAANGRAEVTAPQPDWERYTGQRWPAYRDSGFIEMVHPDDREAHTKNWQHALAARESQVFPSRVWNAATQSWRHCETVAVPLKDEHGDVIEWVGATNDVEDRHQVGALEHLRASDERSRLAESAAKMAMWEWDLGERFIWSEGLDRMLDLQHGAGTSYVALLERVHPDDREPIVEAYRDAARERTGLDRAVRVFLPGGEMRWLLARGSFLPATRATPARMVGITIDITERVEAEQRERFLATATKELVASLDEAEVLSKATHLAVPQLGDLCTAALFDDNAALSMTVAGGTASARALVRRTTLRNWRVAPGSDETVGDVIGRGEPALVPETTAEWMAAAAPGKEQREIARQLGVRSVMTLPLVARGHTIGVMTVVSTSAHRRYGQEDLAFASEFAGRVSIIAENARLLNELLRTTEDLRYANAAKDDFLGMVSHELRTPLTTILGNADVLRRVYDEIDTETRTRALEDIHDEAARLQRLIENMLTLARLERGDRAAVEPVVVPHLVERVVKAQRRAQPDRRFELAPVDGAAVALASGDYVEQVVTNLITNAAKYSPEEAPVEVSVRHEGGEVLVDVLDRGIGIAADEADRLFDPFYRSSRTAASAPGIGVGLAVCKRIIEAQHGRLWARQRPGGGSDFGFALPAVGEAA